MQRDLGVTSFVPPCLLGLDKSTEIESELCLIQFFFFLYSGHSKSESQRIRFLILTT